MFKSICLKAGGYLYRLGGGDIQTLNRDILGSISPQEDFLSSLADDQKILFLNDIKAVKANKSFNSLLGFLTKSQVDWMAMRVDEQNLRFARGTLNGLSLINEEIDRTITRLAPKDNVFNPLEVL